MPKDKNVTQQYNTESVAAEVADHRLQAHYVITIQKVDRVSKNSVDPVPVGVNGVMYAIRRGRPALVPACVKEALEHAVEIAYEAEDDDASKREPREVMSYPFNVLEGPIDPDTVKKRRAAAAAAATA